MVPPLKPLPGGTLTDAVANGPWVASMPATVGSGPRWYGLSAAAAGWAVISVTRAARTSMMSPGSRRDVPAGRMVYLPRGVRAAPQRWDGRPHIAQFTARLAGRFLFVNGGPAGQEGSPGGLIA